MLLWTIWWIAASLLLILLIHYLYTYLKNAVTIPIIDDALTRNNKRYDDMLAPVMNDMKIANNRHIEGNDNSDVIVNETMKDELQAFLDDLKINKHQDVNDIGTTT